MKYIILATISIICSTYITGQDTSYYAANINPSEQVQTIKKIVEFNDSLDLYFAILFDENGYKERTYYSSRKDGAFYEGRYTRFDSLGRVNWYQTFTKNKLEGELKSFWPNGKVKRIDLYANGKFIEGKCYNGLGNEIDYYDFQIKPSFPGGDNALVKQINKHLKYPKKARKQGVEGFVFMEILINKNGMLKNPQVVSAPSNELAKAASRVIEKIKKHKWNPGRHDGEFVDVMYKLPIRFKLTD